MNKWDFIILAIILLMVIVAFHFARDRKKNGCCDCGTCGACDLCAKKDKCNKENKEI